eukprot:6203413-Pleurochrysis_carterae.AAC.2
MHRERESNGLLTLRRAYRQKILYMNLQDGRKWISAGWLGSTHRERQGLRRTLEQLGPSSNSAISIDASTWDHLPFRGGVRRSVQDAELRSLARACASVHLSVCATNVSTLWHLPFCVTACANEQEHIIEHHIAPHRPRTQARLLGRYLEELGRYHFVLAPRGNGIDTHRLWEALLVGTIPIVKVMRSLLHFEHACVPPGQGVSALSLLWQDVDSALQTDIIVAFCVSKSHFYPSLLLAAT